MPACIKMIFRMMSESGLSFYSIPGLYRSVTNRPQGLKVS